MKNLELLCPVGDFDCLKAAVQNGADAVYFGASLFNARASATNFNYEELKQVIEYCKIRDVKSHLTLNILIKNSEFQSALELAQKAYEFGIDAIIVQDIGLARYLIKNLPNLPIHGSTQMTIHNLEGAKELENLGFKRVVLSRELSIQEIDNISRNTNIETEVFIHGALCISYSGQCLFSSTVGGRSGNRGKCAQPCRLPYKLFEESNKTQKLDEGYILSTRDLCGLECIPDLINAKVDCFKIEGRMKTPEYVATVTRIYRKYIDLYNSEKPYIIDKKDKETLMQVFNRGEFSTGHLKTEPNRNLIFKDKPNHMGILVGNIIKNNTSKGIITLKTLTNLSIGDTISFENESTRYTISELMDNNNNNIKLGEKNNIVNFGRMKGNIKVGDNVYKLSDINLSKEVKNSLTEENKKIELKANVLVKKNEPIQLTISAISPNPYTYKKQITVTSDILPEEAKNAPVTRERIIAQLQKTNNTPYTFKDIKIDMDDNLFIPKFSVFNELRRDSLNQFENLILENSKREPISLNISSKTKIKDIKKPKISLLLNTLNKSFDYSNLNMVDNIYVPIKYFLNKDFKNILHLLSLNSNLYIFLPTIIKDNFRNLFLNSIENILKDFKIKGFVVSNIGDFELLKHMQEYEFIGNFTLNSFNDFSIDEYAKLNLKVITLSPELNKSELIDIANNSKIPCELIVYGKLPIMTINYCLLGKSNKCYPECSSKCKERNSKFYITDRLNFNFRIIPDNMQTITTIYNSKTTSINYSELPIEQVRISILDEDIEEINNIINHVSINERLEGTDFTNGHMNKEV